MADENKQNEERVVIGPALPPHLLNKPEKDSLKTEDSSEETAFPLHLLNKPKKYSLKTEDSSEETVPIGPTLPPHLLNKPEKDSLKTENILQETIPIGPALPPHMLKKVVQEEDNSEEEKSDAIGPSLPPHMLNKNSQESTCIGPYLPPHLRQQLLEQSSTSSNVEVEDEEEVTNDEDDGEIYGPLPVGSSTYSKSQIALEERALQLKMDQLESKESKATVREEWMLELPEVKAANLGLGPRQFRAKAGPDFSDRSSWTDTPNKKQKKEVVDLKKETELKEIRKRDEEQEKISKKHKKKNKESLLELHQNEMKKKKKDEGQGERRPFSREIDLQVNRFDEAQKKAILKKAQLLDDRFSSGQSKFL